MYKKFGNNSYGFNKEDAEWGNGWDSRPVVEITTNKRTPIPHNLLDPHYSDSRFARGKTHTIFLARGYRTESDFGSDSVKGANYNYSDRIHMWYYDEYKEASEQATKIAGSRFTALYFEELLSILYKKRVNLVHIIAGVNVSSGYSYLVFGTIDKAK